MPHRKQRLCGALAVLLIAITGQVACGQGGTGRSDTGPAPSAARRSHFQLADMFELEFASDPQVAPDGRSVVYVRNSSDIMTDQYRGRLWIVSSTGHRPLTDFDAEASSPRWSPDGKRLAYIAKTKHGSEIFIRWLDTGATARITNLAESPFELAWSPDGQTLAFSMLVREKAQSYVTLPAKPEGAEWAKPFKYIDTLVYRSDGRGYLKEGFTQIFVVPAEGGTPRQVTEGKHHHGGRVAWSPDGKSLYLSANRRSDWELEPLDFDLYRLTLADGKLTQLTHRKGPDQSPSLSRDGTQLAYVGSDDVGRSYHQSELYVLSTDGQTPRCLTTEFDRDAQHPTFAADGEGVYFQFDDEGNTKVGYVSLKTGKIETVTDRVGGVTIGRPYASGSYSVSDTNAVAFTQSRPDRPADVGFVGFASEEKRRTPASTWTSLNEDLLAHKQLGQVEEFRYKSSFDGRAMHGWIVTPPDFDSKKRYPLLLEIHGGPFANYGGRFSSEIQLYAAAGYVVVYINPRGSTGYGDKFTALIDQNYPSQDYDDLMSGVDAVIERGYIDRQRLYVTGGSGGGVLSSWIVGKTNRFSAAVVVKPVINWYSFVLTADNYNFFAKYWFGKLPWEDPASYLKRSPISLVGNVTTPTMLITGEQDYRTPISETEQFYQALKLRKIDAALVRVPDAPHNIGVRPSQTIALVAHVLKWFEQHPGPAARP